jgi:hypothetical protein
MNEHEAQLLRSIEASALRQEEILKDILKELKAIHRAPSPAIGVDYSMPSWR